MVGAVVSPSTVVSPTTPDPPPAVTSTLFGTVHDTMIHSESDWMNYHDGPVTEDDLFLVAEEMANEWCFGGGVPDNERPKWNVDKTGKDVVITLGESWEKVWRIAQEEIKAYRNRVKELSGKNFEDLESCQGCYGTILGKSQATHSAHGVVPWAFVREGLPFSWHVLCSEGMQKISP